MDLSHPLNFFSLTYSKASLGFSSAVLEDIHVNGVASAWWGTATFGLIYYVVPKLCARPLINENIAKVHLYLWNITMLLTVITLALGYNQGIEVGEAAWQIDVLVVISFLLLAYNVFGTVFKRKEPHLYVSLWYIMGSIIWSSLNYIIGNFVGVYLVSGVNSAGIHGFYLHNTVGMLITPMGVAMAYYFLPAAAKNPLYSHKLSIIGFWTIAFFYPFTGAHHYLFSPIQIWVQTVAIVTSMMLIIPVWTVVTNFYGTMRGKWHLFPQDFTVKFLIVGIVFYVITCLQGTTQALRSIQPVIHFTDWVVGHAHLAIFGVFTMWLMGIVYYIMPKLTGRELYSRTLGHWHFWLVLIGFSAMALDLWFGGLVEGFQFIRPEIPFIDIIQIMKPFWIIRSIAGLTMFIGFVIFAYNVFMTAKAGKTQEGEQVVPSPLAGEG